MASRANYTPVVPGINLKDDCISVLSMLRSPGIRVDIYDMMRELGLTEGKVLGCLTTLRRQGYDFTVDLDLRDVVTTDAGWPKILADAMALAK